MVTHLYTNSVLWAMGEWCNRRIISEEITFTGLIDIDIYVILGVKL